jgi:hypothetical protein
MAVNPEEFFTGVNIASAGVAALAVSAAANALYQFRGVSRKATAFISALVIAYVVVGMQAAPQWFDWILAFFNACLLFCSALGINEVGRTATRKRAKKFIATKPFFGPWFEEELAANQPPQ